MSDSTRTDTVATAANTVVETVQQTATSAADTAKQAVSNVVDTVQDATSTVTGTIDQAADTAADKLHDVATTVREAGSSSTAPAIQQQTVQATANVLDKTAQYLREGDLDLILNDVRNAVRRHPLRTLALGLGLGYVVRGTLMGGTSQPGTQTTRQSTRHGTTPRSAANLSTPVVTPTPPLTSPGELDAPIEIVPPVLDTALNETTAETLLYGIDANTTGDAAASATLGGDVATIVGDQDILGGGGTGLTGTMDANFEGTTSGSLDFETDTFETPNSGSGSGTTETDAVLNSLESGDAATTATLDALDDTAASNQPSTFGSAVQRWDENTRLQGDSNE